MLTGQRAVHTLYIRLMGSRSRPAMRALHGLLLASLFLAGGLTGCLGGKGDTATPAAAPSSANTTAMAAPVDNGSMNASSAFTGTGAVAHSHDYWLGRERVTLLDEDINVDPFTATFFTFFDVSQGTPGVGGTFVNLPDGTTVFEGTGKMEITASWSAPTISGVAARWRTAASNDFSEPKTLATGIVTSVPVTPEMSDMPHAKSSRWAFLLTPASSGQVMEGTLHLKIDIVKMRDIELFPAHPDLFAGAHQLTLFDGPATSSQQSIASQIVDGVSTMGKPGAEQGVASQKVVPMNAVAMMANVTIVDTTGNLGKVSAVNLTVKTADSNGFRGAKLIHTDDATHTYTFAWLVDMRQTDSPYAKQSQWRFDLRVGSDPTGMGGSCGGCSDTKTDYKLVVLAFDAPIDGAKALPTGGRGGN